MFVDIRKRKYLSVKIFFRNFYVKNGGTRHFDTRAIFQPPKSLTSTQMRHFDTSHRQKSVSSTKISQRPKNNQTCCHFKQHCGSRSSWAHTEINLSGKNGSLYTCPSIGHGLFPRTAAGKRSREKCSH